MLPSREDELPVHRPQGPEDEGDKEPDGKGGAGEHDVLQPSHRRLSLYTVGEQAEGEEDELETHVEEGEIFGRAAE